MNDEAYMRRAIALCEEKMAAGEGGYCATIIVRDGEVIGEGWNNVAETHDATGHCEINAIRDAGARTGNWDLLGLRALHDVGALRHVRRGDLVGADRFGCSTAISSPKQPTSVSTSASWRLRSRLRASSAAAPYRRLLGDETFAMFKAWWDSGDRTTI